MLCNAVSEKKNRCVNLLDTHTSKWYDSPELHKGANTQNWATLASALPYHLIRAPEQSGTQLTGGKSAPWDSFQLSVPGG